MISLTYFVESSNSNMSDQSSFVEKTSHDTSNDNEEMSQLQENAIEEIFLENEVNSLYTV